MRDLIVYCRASLPMLDWTVYRFHSLHLKCHGLFDLSKSSNFWNSRFDWDLVFVCVDGWIDDSI